MAKEKQTDDSISLPVKPVFLNHYSKIYNKKEETNLHNLYKQTLASFMFSRKYVVD